MSSVISEVPESVATILAKAHNAPVKSPLPAIVALACNAHTISAERPPIPESVATAERISQRLALLIVPLHSIEAFIFLHNAPEPVVVQIPDNHTLLPIPPAFGGSTQEYGAE